MHWFQIAKCFFLTIYLNLTWLQDNLFSFVSIFIFLNEQYNTIKRKALTNISPKLITQYPVSNISDKNFSLVELFPKTCHPSIVFKLSMSMYPVFKDRVGNTGIFQSLKYITILFNPIPKNIKLIPIKPCLYILNLYIRKNIAAEYKPYKHLHKLTKNSPQQTRQSVKVYMLMHQ